METSLLLGISKILVVIYFRIQVWKNIQLNGGLKLELKRRNGLEIHVELRFNLTR